MASTSFDVFLSYNRDDKAAVEIIAKKLLKKGITPWLDKWNLVPGVPWQPEIESALCECRTCAVVVGRSGIGPWQNEEMRAAIQRRVTDKQRQFRVIPVLLPGATQNGASSLPSFLIGATWVEFSDGLQDRNAFHQLVSGIRGVQPGPLKAKVEEPQTEWVLVLSATLDDVTKPVAEAILEHLRKLSGDVRLTIKKITRGSVRITFTGSVAGFQRLRSLADSGRLNSILGIDVSDLVADHANDSPTAQSALSDADLVVACAASNDPKHWELFTQRFHPVITSAVYRVCSRFQGLPIPVLEDLVQETYLKLLDRRRHLLTRQDSIHGFLKAFAAKVAIDYLKTAAPYKSPSLSHIAEAEYDPASLPNQGGASQLSIERLILSHEVDSVLTQGPDLIDPRDRQIFWLYYRSGLTAREISELPWVNISVRGVESTLSRLIELLRKRLASSPKGGLLSELESGKPAKREE
jgi:RNA polymerase sigma factor (sigma-70 family)